MIKRLIIVAVAFVLGLAGREATMNKKQLKSKVAELEARIAELERELEIAGMMRGYLRTYIRIPQPQPYIGPGDPGYMPALPDHLTTGPDWLYRPSKTAGS
jgi:hypothetical protein